MELRHLRYFIAVAEELHFGRAAARLHISQQPLSRQIRDLENELKVQLFDRTKRTIRLTEAGEIFLAEARKTLQQAERAVLLAQRVSRGEIGQLAVGFTGPALNSLLLESVRQFRERYPEVELTLNELRTIEQVEALKANRLHLGLLHPPIDDGSLILETLHREKLVAVVPNTHPLAREVSQSISLKELAGESFILFPRRVGPQLYDQIISFCQQAGFSPNIVQETIPQQTILGLVSVGVGIALMPASVRNLGRFGVAFRELAEPAPELELAVAWHPNTMHPALPSLLGIAREVALMLSD